MVARQCPRRRWAPRMEHVIVVTVLAIWLFLVLPAVLLPFIPRNPEARPARAPHPTGPLTFLPPATPGDRSGGQAVA